MITLMYDLIKDSSKYYNTTGSLQFYSEGEAINFHGNIANTADF